MRCKICGIELDEHYKFCPDCGTQITIEEVSIFCEKCGTKLQEGYKYCLECGTSIEKISVFKKLYKGAFILLIVPFITITLGLPILSGIIFWIIVGKLLSTSWIAKIFYKGFQKFIISPKPTRKRGELLWKEPPLQSFTWKQIFWEEGYKKSLLPILMVFGIINLILSQYETFSFDWDYILGGEGYSIFFYLIVFSPCLTFIFPIIWLLSESGWIVFDETQHQVIRVGDRIITLLKGIAGTGTLAGLFMKLLAFGDIVDTIAFILFFFLISAGPIYIVTSLYLKWFHSRYSLKFRAELEKYIPYGHYQVFTVKFD